MRPLNFLHENTWQRCLAYPVLASRKTTDTSKLFRKFLAMNDAYTTHVVGARNGPTHVVVGGGGLFTHLTTNQNAPNRVNVTFIDAYWLQTSKMVARGRGTAPQWAPTSGVGPVLTSCKYLARGADEKGLSGHLHVDYLLGDAGEAVGHVLDGVADVFGRHFGRKFSKCQTEKWQCLPVVMATSPLFFLFSTDLDGKQWEMFGNLSS